MIDSEVRYLQDFTESENEPNQKNNFSDDYHEQAIRQAGHVYHSLFWGNCNKIIVRQTCNASLSGQTGLVIWYFQKRKQFLVHLATKNEPFPTLFSGERQFIEPRFLEQRVVSKMY